MNPNLFLAIALSYLLGSIPFSQIIAKSVKGIDLHKVGSLNIGARNLFRNVGTGWGLLGGLLDFSKGYVSVLLAQRLEVPYPAYLFAGAAAVAGHNWPIWLRFRGGKGLSTAAGVAVHLGWLPALVSFGIWGLIMQFTHNVIIASIAGFGSLLAIFLTTGSPSEKIFLVVVLAAVVFLASLPDMIATLRSKGAVKKYFQDPEILYKKQIRKQQAASKRRKGTR